MAVERTLILAKPDAVARSLAGEIVARFERRGLQLRAARLVVASRELGSEHYAEHTEKPFFGELVDFITSGPTLAFVLEGEGAIATARKTIGATNPADADPGSLRGEFAARDAEQPRPRVGLARVRGARDRVVVPRWAGLRTRRRTASPGRSRTPSTPTAAPATRGRRRRSTGASGTFPSRASACSATSTDWTSSSSGAGRRTSPRGSRGGGRGRSGSTSRRRSSRRRAACSGRQGWSSRSSKPTPPRPGCPTRASTSSCPSTAPRSGSTRTGGSRRRRGCSVRAAGSSSSATRRSPSSATPRKRTRRRPTACSGRSAACTGSSGSPKASSSISGTGTGSICSVRTASRSSGSRSSTRPRTRVEHPYYTGTTLEWAQRWPAEEVWAARKRS